MTMVGTSKVGDVLRGRRMAASLEAIRPFMPVLILLLILCIVLASANDRFATVENAQNILTGVSTLWIVSMGMTFVLISGGADLSVGAWTALAGICIAVMVQAGIPSAFAIPTSIAAVGIAGGLLNGILIGNLKLSFFVVTLATSTGISGLVSLWTDTQTIFVSDPIIAFLGTGSFLQIGMPIWLMGAVFAAALYFQSRTFLGRDIYAVGGNATAARLSGIRVPVTLYAVYGMSAASAAIGSVLSIGRIGLAGPQVDQLLPLDCIAAVLLGGTSLAGGLGSVWGSAFGVIFIGVLQNGLSVAGVPSFWQEILTGVILVVAVSGDRISFRRLTGFRRSIGRRSSLPARH